MDQHSNLDDEASPIPAHKCPWNPTAFVDCKDSEVIKKSKCHAAHLMLWTRDENPVFPYHTKDFPMLLPTKKETILMYWQLDGSFGFPGGYVEEFASTIPSTFAKCVDLLHQTVKKKLLEQIPFGKDISPTYIYSCFPSGKEDLLMLHFFTFELTPSQMEVVSNYRVISNLTGITGLTRVPFYTLKDGTHGKELPTFLTKSFVGNSMEQLFKRTLKLGFLNEAEVREAYKVAFQIIKKR